MEKQGKYTLKKELALCFTLILIGFLDWLTTVLGLVYFGGGSKSSVCRLERDEHSDF